MKNRMWQRLGGCLLVLGLLLSSVGVAWADSGLRETIGAGEVDWEAGVVRISGNGVPPAGITGAQARLLAQRAAKTDAYRNALEVLEGVRVSSATQVRDFTVASDTISTSVDGLVRGAMVESQSCDLANTCTVVLVVPLAGQEGLAEILGGVVYQQPTSGGEISFSYGVATSVTPTTIDLPASQPYGVSIGGGGPYTGIVIDARGLNVRPAMYPQVFTTQGTVIYGPGRLDPDTLGMSTMAAYARSLEQACALARVGAHPLVVKAVAAVKSDHGESTDVALDSVAAAAVQQADAEGALFARAAVAIVID